MPWCPKCKTEYRPEFDTCADCGTELVQDNPKQEKEPKPPIDAVILRPSISFLLSVAVSIATLGWLDNVENKHAFFTVEDWVFFLFAALAGFVICGYYPRITPKQITIGWALAAAEIWLMDHFFPSKCTPIYWPMVVVMTSSIIISFVIPGIVSAYLVERLKSRRIVLYVLAISLFVLPYLFQWLARQRYA